MEWINLHPQLYCVKTNPMFDFLNPHSIKSLVKAVVLLAILFAIVNIMN
jgi:hypothetical protein